MNKLAELFNDDLFQQMIKNKKVSLIDIISILLFLSSRGIEFSLSFTPASNTSFARLTISFNVSPAIRVSLAFELI